MSRSDRQAQRASLKQEMEVVQGVVNALDKENNELRVQAATIDQQNKFLYRVVAMMTHLNGGSIVLPPSDTHQGILNNKFLVSEPVEGGGIRFFLEEKGEAKPEEPQQSTE